MLKPALASQAVAAGRYLLLYSQATRASRGRRVTIGSTKKDAGDTGKSHGPPGHVPLPERTTLDRVHMAMLLQAGGQATALRAVLEAETQRSLDFLRLANALSALYPKDSEEKRLLDAMLLAAPGGYGVWPYGVGGYGR